MVAPNAALLGWTILFAPLLAGAIILLFGVHRKSLASGAAILGLLTSFGCTLALFAQALQHPHALPFESLVWWIDLPGLRIPFGILIDQLSLLMSLVVTGVGSAIFIYSLGYMHEDQAYSRFFGVLSLFAFSMLTIVLSNNWIQLFIGWELVGFSSYLLIGHWYAKASAADAGKKAFMVNRVADFGFLLGILALWAVSSPALEGRSFHFQTLEALIPAAVQSGTIAAGALPLIGLLLFCGPVGKSAQFPLHVWLPDAMEGPTPVSALIHAATMVAAGVYLLARAFWLFEMVPQTLTVIMWVGGATAFLAACLALAETDLKRILAYSTLSQLGYMVMALGLSGAVAGMFHLTTHAFFKALLFLAAGSVIHGTHEQDIRKLGGLWRSMPWTSRTFLIGALALVGFPGLSGFFSKEEILVLAYQGNRWLYWLGTVTAGLTAFYTTRAWVIAFTGKPRGHHGHESPPVMLVPLVFLAALSLAGGYLGIPAFLATHSVHAAEHVGGQFVTSVSLAVVGFGILLGWLVYYKQAVTSDQLVRALALPRSFAEHRYYIDDLYSWFVLTIQQNLLARFCNWFENAIIIRTLVNGLAWLTQAAGQILRFLIQSGRVQAYVLVFVLGVVWLLAGLR